MKCLIKPKVCIYTPGLGSGGIETFVVNLIKGIDKEKYDIHLVMSIDEESGPQFREDEVNIENIKIYRTCDLNGINKKIIHCVKLYKILKNNEIEIFHSNIDLFNGINLFIARLAGVKIRICHSHVSQSPYELRNGKSLIFSIYKKIMRKMCWKFSNRRCGCSELAMDYAYENRWKNDGNSVVIYNGIDINKFRNKIDISKKKKELGITNKYNIVTVGRLSEEKNPQFIIEIMNEICKQRDDIDLIWVGTGNLKEIINKSILEFKLEERIHMLGIRKDVNEILQCSDVFLLPSKFEGLSFVLIEAQATEIPCIASDVIPNKVNCGGVLRCSLNENSSFWANKIINLIDNEIMLQVEEEKIRKYDIGYMIDQIDKIYNYQGNV